MRKLNSRFSIDGDQLIKTSNGQPVPSEEPTFILRGRDHLACSTLAYYMDIAMKDGCNDEFISELMFTLGEFTKFADEYRERMKQPGITKGL